MQSDYLMNFYICETKFWEESEKKLLNSCFIFESQFQFHFFAIIWTLFQETQNCQRTVTSWRLIFTKILARKWQYIVEIYFIFYLSAQRERYGIEKEEKQKFVFEMQNFASLFQILFTVMEMCTNLKMHDLSYVFLTNLQITIFWMNLIEKTYNLLFERLWIM